MSEKITPTQDLHRERSTATFCPRLLTYILDGSKETTERKETLLKLIVNDPIFSRDSYNFQTREERYQRGLKMIKRVLELRHIYNLSEDDYFMLKGQLDETLPNFLHDHVFVPNLEGQCSEEQAAKWLPLAKSYAIIGSYGQTELSVGSNVGALQTTATFDPATDEFIVHTPCLEATKWWPGCMGRTATHSVIYARLIIAGKDYGVHPFLVQLRSLETHEPLPGITVGDIGPKFGTDSNDNGYCSFNQVRIPRTNMLMKYSKVHRDGTYEKPPHSKMAYGTMVAVRAGIVSNSSTALAKAVTIALRYSAVRRQGGPAIIEYKMQQYRLFTLLSASYALFFTGRGMVKMYENLRNKMLNNDFSDLPEVHATSSGLKSLTTTIAADGIEECRKACGGHGYLKASGLPEHFANYVMSCTVEGDNYLLTQQTTRYLVKAIQSSMEGKKLSGSVKYIELAPNLSEDRCQAKSADDFFCPQTQLKAFRHRATRLALEVASLLQEYVGAGKTPAEAWNYCLVEIARASRAHCMAVVVDSFITGVQECSSQANIQAVLWKLSQLFALSSMEKEIGTRIYLES
eukprot:TRINITY_DN1804_c0_g1_i2.p1 TRINITY_DN1804_c0_g1~~TRINITY_DN1804_c0_g1_i2.p1  ORF type:complete len:574 (-),score=110.92 TRINITY_DN1804_c0_g1_i2:625-2346(-)